MILNRLKEIKPLAIVTGFLVFWAGGRIVGTIFYFFMSFILMFMGMSSDHVTSLGQTQPLGLLIPGFLIFCVSMSLGAYVAGRMAKQHLILNGVVLGAVSYFYFIWRQSANPHSLWFFILACLLLIPIGGFGASLAKTQNETGSNQITRVQFLKIAGLALLLGGIPIHLIGLWVANIPRFFSFDAMPMWKYLNSLGWISLFLLLTGLVYWTYCMIRMRKAFSEKYNPSAFPQNPTGLTTGETFSVWLVMGLVIAPCIWFAVGLWNFNYLLTAIEKAGYPTQYSYHPPSVVDDQNAVFWVRKALACSFLKGYDGKNFYGSPNVVLETKFIDGAYSGKFDTGDIPQVRALLNHNAEAIRLIQRAAQCPASNWDWDVPAFLDNGGGYFPNRHTSQLLYLNRLLVCQALLDAQEGNTTEALDLIRDGLLWAKVYDSAGDMLDEMLAMAVNKLCLIGAPYVLEKSSVARAKEKWGDLLNPDEMPQRVKKAVSLDFFSLPVHRIQRIPDFSDMSGLDGYYFPFLPLDLDAQLRYGKETLDACHEPYAQTAPLIDQAEKKFQRTSWWFSSLCTPMFGHMYGKSLVNTAQFRMALLALASRDYKAQNGRWPDGGKDLNGFGLDPSTFIDPFSGNPMVFKKQGSHLLIYSIGFDLKDEQGGETKDEEVSRTGNLDWLL